MSMQACWSPSGRLFTLVLPDNSIWLIDVESAQVVRRIIFAEQANRPNASNNNEELAENVKQKEERWELREVEREQNVEISEAERNKQQWGRESLLNFKTICLSEENLSEGCCSTMTNCNNRKQNKIIAITWTTLPVTNTCDTTSYDAVQHVYRNLAMHVALPPFTNALFAEMHLLDEPHTTLHQNHSSYSYYNNNDDLRTTVNCSNTVPLPLLLILTSTGMLHVVLGGLREVHCIRCFDCNNLALPFRKLLTNSESYDVINSNSNFEKQNGISSSHITQFVVSHEHSNNNNEENTKEEYDEYIYDNKDKLLHKCSNITPADLLALLHDANHVNHSKGNSTENNNNEIGSCLETVLYLVMQNTSCTDANKQSYFDNLEDEERIISSCNTCVVSHLYKVNVGQSLQQILFANNHVITPAISITTKNAETPLLTWVCVAEHSLFALHLARKIIGKWTQYIIPTVFISQLQLHKFAYVIAELLVERCVMLDEVRLLSYLCTLNLPKLWQRKKEIAMEAEHMKALMRHLVLPHLRVALQLASYAINMHSTLNINNNNNNHSRSENQEMNKEYFTKLAEILGRVIHDCEYFIARNLIVEARHVDHLLHWLVQRSSLLLNACDEVELQKIIIERHQSVNNSKNKNNNISNEETNKGASNVVSSSKAQEVEKVVEEDVSFDIDELSGDKNNINCDEFSNNNDNDDMTNDMEESTPLKWYRPGVVYNVEPLPAEWHPSLFDFLNTFQTYYKDNQEWALEALTQLTLSIKEVHSGQEELLCFTEDISTCVHKEHNETSNNRSVNSKKNDASSECNIQQVLFDDNNNYETLDLAFIDLDVMPCTYNAINATTGMQHEEETEENKLFACYTITPPLQCNKVEHNDKSMNSKIKCYQRTYEAINNYNNNHYDAKHNYSGMNLQIKSTGLVENLNTSSRTQSTNAGSRDVNSPCQSEIVYYCHLNDGRHLFVMYCNAANSVKEGNRKSNSSVKVITVKERKAENDENDDNICCKDVNDEHGMSQKHITFTGKQTVSIQGLRALSASQVCVSVSKAREFIVIAANDTIIIIDLYAEEDDENDDNEDEGEGAEEV